MKILFLDIDGVLVNRQSFGREARDARPPNDRRTPFHPSCVEQLNRIIASTGCDLVMSSTWRADENLIEMREFLRMRGISRLLLDFTPQPTDDAQPRGLEIQQWLDQTDHTIESFVIVDDEADLAHLTPRLIRTNFDDGLTAADADRTIELLNYLL